jgi:hypothetical protein
MEANSLNMYGRCERCGRFRPFVLASGFNPDESFRMLCSGCDRIERPRNQRALFVGVAPVWIGEPEPEEEPEPVYVPRESPQMSLFMEVYQ